MTSMSELPGMHALPGIQLARAVQRHGRISYRRPKAMFKLPLPSLALALGRVARAAGRPRAGLVSRGRVLVTGGCGYIGSHTVLKLPMANYEARLGHAL